MKVKIIKADSEHGQNFLELEGNLEFINNCMQIDRGETYEYNNRYLATSSIEKIIVKTRHTTYEMEVL